VKRFEKALPYSIDMVIPGYEKSYPKGIFKVLTPIQRDSQEWYHQFVAEIQSAIGRKYLPVCRMGDGVLVFAIGRFIPFIRGSKEKLVPYIKRLLVSLLHRGINRLRGGINFSIGMGDLGFAEYSKLEWKSLRQTFGAALQEIGKLGFLCPFLSYRDNQLAQQYYVPFIKWLKSNEITLDQKNYYPFYFVYALLNGPDRGIILGQKRILVITTLDRNKEIKIEKALKAEGAEYVQFINVKKSRTMFDKLNLEKIQLPVDVCLIAAGMGTAQLLLQLKSTGTLCLDAGWAMEAIFDPEKHRSHNGARSFCWADFERNGDYTPL